MRIGVVNTIAVGRLPNVASHKGERATRRNIVNTVHQLFRGNLSSSTGAGKASEC